MGLLFAVNVWKKIEDFLIKKCIPFTANNKSKNAQAHDLKILDCSISYHQNTLTPSQHLKNKLYPNLYPTPILKY